MGQDFTKFKDIHKEQRGFIIACGPSLNTIDLSKLRNEICFGTNLSYKSGHISQYNFMGDKQIASQFYKEIQEVRTHWFVSKAIKIAYFIDNPLVYYFTGTPVRRFCKNLSNGIMHGGGTVTFLAMQMAYWMGINPLYVVGLDHWKTLDQIKAIPTGKANINGQPLVRATGNDKLHFTKDYYGRGTEYFLPTIGKMEASYGMARLVFEGDGRRIYNASAETALPDKVLPRVNFEDIV